MAMRGRLLLSGAGLACVLALTGCVCSQPRGYDPDFPTAGNRVMSPGETRTKTELYFGLSRPGGAEKVSAEEWRGFLDNFVTPRFPDGLTV